MADVIKPSNVHDVAKLLLAFTMIWAYFNFSQFLIIWSANLPEEIPWYIERLSHGWQWVSLGVLLGQFLLPFFLLLSRDLKRTASRVAKVAIWILLMRYVDFFWNLAPAMHRETPLVNWIDVATVVVAADALAAAKRTGGRAEVVAEMTNLARGPRAAESEPIQAPLREELLKWMRSIDDPLLKGGY